MSYTPPSVGPAGLTLPSYKDILDDNLQQFLNIFGANQYIGNDSAIYQFISVLSLKQSDTCQALQFVYNNAAPTTAVGAGLDRIVKLNGIARTPFTYSTAVLTLVGNPGTVITNGVAQDVNGNQWNLPQPTVTIPGSGTIMVTATCTSPGNITAEPGTITTIATPVGGWSSVTNSQAAVPGVPIETDSQLRARQAISVALPSETLLAGTVAALLALPSIGRVVVYENPTNATDANGNPPHSITAVVEGGLTELAIATAIYDNRGIGCLTNNLVNGYFTAQSISVIVTDPNTGYTMPIGYLTPDYVPIYVDLSVHLLAGGTSATLTAIQTAITNYLNELAIGELVTLSALYAAGMSVTPNLLEPEFSIRALTLGTAPSPVGTSDIPMAFNEVAQAAYIMLTQV